MTTAAEKALMDRCNELGLTFGSYRARDYASLYNLWKERGLLGRGGDTKEDLDRMVQVSRAFAKSSRMTWMSRVFAWFAPWKVKTTLLVVRDKGDNIIGSVFLLVNGYHTTMHRACIKPKYEGRGLMSRLIDVCHERVKNESVYGILIINKTHGPYVHLVPIYEKKGYKTLFENDQRIEMIIWFR